MNKERKSWLLNQTLTAMIFFVLFIYAIFTTIPWASKPRPNVPIVSSSNPNHSGVKVYLYDLPSKFNYGVVKHFWITLGFADVATLKYPSHQHSLEWHLFKELARPEMERFGSPIIRVSNPNEADLFYIPFFSSLSWVVSKAHIPEGSGRVKTYSDSETQEELLTWLKGQEYWRRSKGRDHVLMCQNPNALNRVMDRVKNMVLLVSDFGRIRPDQSSLVKDVVVPCSHRISAYNGDIGVENRKTLLFFMGNPFRKGGGKVRDFLFQVLENEEDVIMKHGPPSETNQRLASQGMHSSKFCLDPAGTTPASCRLFDAILSMCIPVIVSDRIELPFEDVIDYRKIAIFVDSTSAVKQGFLVAMLRNVTTERILEYQRELKLVKRYFDYKDPNGTLNEVWRQVSQKLPLIKLMIKHSNKTEGLP